MPNHHTHEQHTTADTTRLVVALETIREWATRAPHDPWRQRAARAHEARLRARLVLAAERVS